MGDVIGMSSLQVNIQVPGPDLQSDKIAITGLASHLDRAKEGLLERVKELQADQEDRVSMHFIKAHPCVLETDKAAVRILFSAGA